MNDKFEKDLRDSCTAAAKFLREKNTEWNKGRKTKERSYSGEREFVAEVYRLLIEKDKSYLNTIFVDYLRPEEKEKNEKKMPDLVYRNGVNEKSIVEIKTPVNSRADGDPRPWKGDFKVIAADYKKLNEHYLLFESKFLLVAYLGDPILKSRKKFPLKNFRDWLKGKFPDTDKIKVIVC